MDIQRKDYLGTDIIYSVLARGILPARTVVFSPNSTPWAWVFNKCIAAAFLKEILIPQMNSEARATERRHNWDDPDKTRLLNTIKHIVKHVSYLHSKNLAAGIARWNEQRIVSQAQGVQRREYDWHIKEARTLRQPQLVEMLQLLGRDGMPSDEEVRGHGGRVRAVHKHLWRLEEATQV
ncbi:hypothetical protein PM082_018171 [Marasmius tenuissimus]|nr:hypothetical protein PM082_018171 [Marasmius tenuissimus]